MKFTKQEQNDIDRKIEGLDEYTPFDLVRDHPNLAGWLPLLYTRAEFAKYCGDKHKEILI